MEEQIKEFATDVANEISARAKFDIAEIEGIIFTRLKLHLPSIIGDNANKAEVEYQNLLAEISKYRVGHPKYIELSYKVGLARAKKAFVNRALNNIKRDDNFSNLCQFIYDKLGEDFINEFCNSKGISFPKSIIR